MASLSAGLASVGNGVAEASSELIKLLELYRKALFDLCDSNGRHPMLAARVRSLLCLILTECCACLIGRQMPKENDFVRAAKTFMKAKLAERVTVEDVTAHLGLSKSRFYELFRAGTGQTPHEYLQRLRVNAACHALTHTSMTITEIAMRYNFSSSQHFARTFRQYTGRTPTAHRRSSEWIERAPAAQP
jgi:AraC-like DNA-binding protein